MDSIFDKYRPLSEVGNDKYKIYVVPGGPQPHVTDWVNSLFRPTIVERKRPPIPNRPEWRQLRFDTPEDVEEFYSVPRYLPTWLDYVVFVGAFEPDWSDEAWPEDQPYGSFREPKEWFQERTMRIFRRHCRDSIKQCDSVMGYVSHETQHGIGDFELGRALDKHITKLRDREGDWNPFWSCGAGEHSLPEDETIYGFFEDVAGFDGNPYADLWQFWIPAVLRRRAEEPREIHSGRGEDLFGNAYSQLRQQSKLGAIPALTHQLKIPHTRYAGDWGNRKLRAIIEIDEDHHRQRSEFEADKKRQREIELLGWRVWRFTEREVLADPEGCARQAAAFLTTLTDR
jgi:very-short-patch-repair endonuclease